MRPLSTAALLPGCGLPEAWQGQAQWRILATHWGDGTAFLHAWHAWKADPKRPRFLHYCAITTIPAHAKTPSCAVDLPSALRPLASTLCAQWAGLTSGFHRMALDDGHVLLTLCIGDVKPMLRELAFTADSLFLANDRTEPMSPAWDLHAMKALARRCARGTRYALQDTVEAVQAARVHLASCGFVESTAAATVPLHGVSGVYLPHWEPRQRQARPPAARAASAVVIGGGLAGAAVAHSLARRGWLVQVLDSHLQPAQGASGLPAGLLAPLVSPDDNIPSRLSRSGLRITLHYAKALLAEGVDWWPTGVLQRQFDGERDQPTALTSRFWSHPASTEQLQRAGLAPDTRALWHPQAASIKPAALVHALMAHPNITWQGGCTVASLHHHDGVWRVLGDHGAVHAETALVVVCAAVGSAHLLADATVAQKSPPLQAIRGQISWGRSPCPAFPPFPVNGHGSLISGLSDHAGPFWALGSTYERDQTQVTMSAHDLSVRHKDNLDRLRVLLPHLTPAVTTALQESACDAFVGIRCAAPDRLPLVGLWARPNNNQAEQEASGGLWVSTAMGSRGLTFALLCAELLAARLHDEPWPLEHSLAHSLDAGRLH